MSASDIKAGGGYVELTLRDSLQAQLASAQKKIKAFSENIGKIGSQFLKVGAAISAPFAIGAKEFSQFETQIANISTLGDFPKETLKNFEAGLQNMAIKFGESTETLSKGLYDIISASVPAADALDVLEVAAKASTAGLTDTGVAADAITTILNSYGKSATEAADVSDLLFTIVKRGKTTFGELAPAIGNVASIAASGGVGLDELGASLATLTRSGVKTDAAVTAVTAIITAFLSPTAEAASYAEELGFSMNTATLQSEGLIGVFKKISGLPADAISKLFPNVRALKGVLPALNNVDGFIADLDAMKNRAGTTETAFSKLAVTLDQALRAVVQSGTVAFQKLGANIGDELKYISEVIVNMIKRISFLIIEFPIFSKVIAATGAAFAVLGGSMLALSFILPQVAATAALLPGVFQSVAAGAALANTAIPKLVASMYTGVGGVGNFKAALISAYGALKSLSAGAIYSKIAGGLSLVKGAFLAATKAIIYGITNITTLLPLLYAKVSAGITALIAAMPAIVTALAPVVALIAAFAAGWYFGKAIRDVVNELFGFNKGVKEAQKETAKLNALRERQIAQLKKLDEANQTGQFANTEKISDEVYGLIALLEIEGKTGEQINAELLKLQKSYQTARDQFRDAMGQGGIFSDEQLKGNIKELDIYIAELDKIVNAEKIAQQKIAAEKEAAAKKSIELEKKKAEAAKKSQEQIYNFTKSTQEKILSLLRDRQLQEESEKRDKAFGQRLADDPKEAFENASEEYLKARKENQSKLEATWENIKLGAGGNESAEDFSQRINKQVDLINEGYAFQDEAKRRVEEAQDALNSRQDEASQIANDYFKTLEESAKTRQDDKLFSDLQKLGETKPMEAVTKLAALIGELQSEIAVNEAALAAAADKGQLETVKELREGLGGALDKVTRLQELESQINESRMKKFGMVTEGGFDQQFVSAMVTSLKRDGEDKTPEIETAENTRIIADKIKKMGVATFG